MHTSDKMTKRYAWTSEQAKRVRGPGFSSMTGTDELRELARAGGKAAHAAGTANKFTSETARQAAFKRWEKVRADDMSSVYARLIKRKR